MADSSVKDELDKFWPNMDWDTPENRKALRSAAGYAVTPVVKAAKEFVPQGDLDHHPDKPALEDTIIKKVKSYDGGKVIVAMVGPSYPDGAHGHLVEDGHRIVTHDGTDTGATVEGKEFMLPAALTTEKNQTKRLIEKIQRILTKRR